MTQPTPLDDVKSKALETAQRLLDYRSYGEQEAKALAALRRRVRGHERERCRQWLSRAIETHRAALAFVEAHKSEAFAVYGRDPRDWDFSTFAEPFFLRFADLPRELLLRHLHLVFYIHHLR